MEAKANQLNFVVVDKICVILFLIVLLSLFVFASYIFHNDTNTEDKKPVSYFFQGPIPLDHNETHFRETGETIKNYG